MKDVNSFKNLKIDRKKLLDLGFKREKDKYILLKDIIDNQFELKIEIDNENIIYSDVIEKVFNEEFIQYNVTSATGTFVEKMKQEYKYIINNIISTCSEKNVFKTVYANLIIKYIKDKYNNELEYLWDKFPEYAVARNKINNKWYCTVMIIDSNKIDKNLKGKIEVIDLRINPNDDKVKVDNNKFYPGYHMNKKNWITLKLDGSVNINDIYNMIDYSYNISLTK